MPKTYVLDTNVLLYNPKAFYLFEENDVVIPLAVMEEIDNQKQRQDEIGKNARIVSQQLDALRSDGPLSKGIRLEHGGTLKVESNHQDMTAFPSALDRHKFDNRILALALNLRLANGKPVILVSKDLNLRIKADVMGIAAEDFYTAKVDYSELYRGFRVAYATGAQLNAFYEQACLAWDQKPPPYENEFFILRNSTNASQSALCRYTHRYLRPLLSEDITSWGVAPRNKEQRFALELLLDDNVPVVSIVGKAGTGKTLLALSAGLEKVIEQKIFKRLLIVRPTIPLGDDLGYLPGTKEEKLRPWMQPIYDNLEYLLRDCSDYINLIEDFMTRGVIEMETLTYIRGRSIPKQFIICDEAQNLSPNMIKTLMTRVGEGTKIVFTGDQEQIDHPYLDAKSNGLTYMVEKLKGEPLFGHITLLKGERSRVAELGARLL